MRSTPRGDGTKDQPSLKGAGECLTVLRPSALSLEMGGSGSGNAPQQGRRAQGNEEKELEVALGCYKWSKKRLSNLGLLIISEAPSFLRPFTFAYLRTSFPKNSRMMVPEAQAMSSFKFLP